MIRCPIHRPDQSLKALVSNGNMFPLKPIIFSRQAPDQHAEIHGKKTGQRTLAVAGNATASAESGQTERRQQTDRRQNDRREKQHSILLDTRKVQGRRKSPGRRKSDKQDEKGVHIGISIKG